MCLLNRILLDVKVMHVQRVNKTILDRHSYDMSDLLLSYCGYYYNNIPAQCFYFYVKLSTALTCHFLDVKRVFPTNTFSCANKGHLIGLWINMVFVYSETRVIFNIKLAKSTYDQFSKDRRRQLTYNEDQIHKYERFEFHFI